MISFAIQNRKKTVKINASILIVRNLKNYKD
nr:MAG TPA: hypothetical protein [Caudoviricetes sp.]